MPVSCFVGSCLAAGASIQRYGYNAASMDRKVKSRQRQPRSMLDEAKFRRWLISYRAQNGLRLHEVSKRTGIAISRLSDIENANTKSISLRQLTAFASAWGYKYLADFI